MFKKVNSCDGIYKDSLDVRFTKVCDNHCDFCIERNGLSAKKQDIDKMILSTIQSGKKEILILGGEPLINLENIFKYINGIRDHVNKIYITTSLPHSIIDNYELFSQIADKIDGLNVSLQHYDWKINNKVLHASNNFNRIELLERLCKDYSSIIRVSINLVQCYIDTKYQLDKFLSTMENIGVKHVKINELQHEPDLYVGFKYLYDLNLPSAYLNGCQTDIQLPYNMRITLKRACFCVQPENILGTDEEYKKLKAQVRPDLGYTVLYEDGFLSKHWITNR